MSSDSRPHLPHFLGSKSIEREEQTLSEQPGIADDGFSIADSNASPEDVEKGAQTPIIVRLWAPHLSRN